MIADRYYQFLAFLLALFWFRDDLATATVFVIIPVLFLAMPVFVALLLWQSLFQTFGPLKLRPLAQIRWEISRGIGPLVDRRISKAGKAILKAYEIAPSTALPEQQNRIMKLMIDAYDIDRRVPRILQSSLTATSLGRVLAEAEGLTGNRRNALITALRKVEPAERPLGLVRRFRRMMRRVLAPLVSSKVQRGRISLFTFFISRIES